MKNKINGLFVLVLMIWLTLGCGLVQRVQKSVTDESSNSQKPASSQTNKSLTDRTVEDIADGETTGVPECDEVMKIFSDQMESKDDSWTTKATKNYIIGQVKKSFRKSLEENKNDKAKLAEQCRDYKVQLEKSLREEKEKNK